MIGHFERHHPCQFFMLKTMVKVSGRLDYAEIALGFSTSKISSLKLQKLGVFFCIYANIIDLQAKASRLKLQAKASRL